jgi:hypothetical protein
MTKCHMSRHTWALVILCVSMHLRFKKVFLIKGEARVVH